MGHLPNLIQDLALILGAAALVTLLFKKLRQPVVLGYLIAGFLVGPYFRVFPSVKDPTNISIWAEIGVIFMLFGLGLEFSFKKLREVGKSASVTAVVEIVFMLGIGYLVGQLLGWSRMDSLFLGGILSISSTTIIVRAFDELGFKGRGFVSLVFGVLIVEDLIAILLLVLLSSVAATQSLAGSELVFSSLRLGFFLILWFLLGIYLLPILLRRIHDLLSEETMLIVSIGLCLLMVLIANQVGFSPALGAFVMGSLLAETPQGHAVERVILPVKNLFSAVFFVSVGMLINPEVLRQHWDVIALLAVVTIVGKFFSTFVGAVVSGRSLRHSVQSGLSLAQIGEFSFIIATLGITLKVTSDFLYPIAVAVSAATTFSTPYLIRYSGNFAGWLERRMPTGLRESLERYEAAMSDTRSQAVFTIVWREYGLKVLLNGVLVVAITLFVSQISQHLLACGLAFLLSAPFLWAIVFGVKRHSSDYGENVAEQLRRLQIGVTVARFLVGSVLVGFIVSKFTSLLAVSGVVIFVFAALATFFFSRFSERLYHGLEQRFVSNLTENERRALARQAALPRLAPWNATLAELTVSPDSPFVAKTLQESGIKERFGTTVAMIRRGSQQILAPTRDAMLLPHDTVFVIGTDEQLAALRNELEVTTSDETSPFSDSFGLISLVLLAWDPFVHKSIRECGLREAVDGLIVGIERSGQRHLSPDSGMTLLPGDLIWVVGNKAKIRALRA